MDNYEVGNSKALIRIEIIEYVPNSIVIKTIIKKTKGSIILVPFDTGETFIEKKIPFDTLIKIAQGKAEIIMVGISNLLDTGHSIIIPAHTSNMVRSNERFKMISTIINTDLS